MNGYNNLSMPYLAIPKDENDWIRYVGHCNIFAGKFMEDDQWVMEPEDETIAKLATALEKAGIKHETTTFDWEDTRDGVRRCTVICSYNKPCTYHEEFYLPGLTSFDWIYLENNPYNFHLEFYLAKLL
jgi:hypothetical protein